MNNEYILKHIEKDRPFKTQEECIEYYMDECWVKQDVASDLFYYKVIIDKAIEYIEYSGEFEVEVFDENTLGCLGTELGKQGEYLLKILRGEE